MKYFLTCMLIMVLATTGKNQTLQVEALTFEPGSSSLNHHTITTLEDVMESVYGQRALIHVNVFSAENIPQNRRLSVKRANMIVDFMQAEGIDSSIVSWSETLKTKTTESEAEIRIVYNPIAPSKSARKRDEWIDESDKGAIFVLKRNQLDDKEFKNLGIRFSDHDGIGSMIDQNVETVSETGHLIQMERLVRLDADSITNQTQLRAQFFIPKSRLKRHAKLFTLSKNGKWKVCDSAQSTMIRNQAFFTFQGNLGTTYLLGNIRETVLPNRNLFQRILSRKTPVLIAEGMTVQKVYLYDPSSKVLMSLSEQSPAKFAGMDGGFSTLSHYVVIARKGESYYIAKGYLSNLKHHSLTNAYVVTRHDYRRFSEAGSERLISNL